MFTIYPLEQRQKRKSFAMACGNITAIAMILAVAFLAAGCDKAPQYQAKAINIKQDEDCGVLIKGDEHSIEVYSQECAGGMF